MLPEDEFLSTSRVRLTEMTSLLDAIERDLSDGAALQKLARHFHALAGTGATYGFPRVSELGDEAEGSILPLVKKGLGVDVLVLARWRTIVDEMRRSLLRAPASSRPVSRLPGGAALRTHRILVMEDDATTAVLVRGILAAARYEVEVCRDPAEFEKTLRSFTPDLVLMDVQLGDGVRGHDLVRFMRRDEHFSQLPVIVVTSDSERRAMSEDEMARADAVVTKPVDWLELLSVIAARLER